MHPSVCLLQEAVYRRSVCHVRFGQLGPELFKFLTECCRGVQSCGFGFGHFQLEVHEHINVFVDVLWLLLLGAVFVVKILKFA